jgi:hypothetical protein
MRRSFLVAGWLALVVAGCHREGDENLGLGGESTAAIDPAKLTEPDELLRALSVGGPKLDALLGPHRMQASSSLKLDVGGHPQALEETFDVAWDGHSLRLRHENEEDYGFEAISDGNRLFVKPRYGKWVLRKPEADELERLRKTAELPAAAWLTLLLPSVQVAEAGRAQVAGRPGIKLAMTARSSPGAPRISDEPGKAWRRSLRVKYLSGDVVVDAKSGAPLSIRIDAGFSFERDGKPIDATLSFKQSTLAEAGMIAMPDDWVTLSRPRPMLDRQQLLEGLQGVK